MKLSKLALVLVVALSLAALAAPAGAQCIGGFGVPFGMGCGLGGFGLGGFGCPFGIGTGANFVSSFQTSSSFTTAGVAGFGGIGGFGVPFGLGCGVPFGMGCGLGTPFGWC